ncbi:alternative ribosome rescue aminoacyl-tRNA hydrolase ArfB [Mucilaginibacter sp. L3T2-6]|uniref:alternative ribosome rescue aminoacyl-tRNA hydrolase ArfB n=1 Tax=Mucilaginibacter sp. L3T2-6 TaxID=3062491 RepID=UPI0026744DA4|nr:alternative ribosome rescue aminoacyl-tRNA hydrolase ArfB [Mucilaginibacter sp. L3T2-6]MDO3644498.1 alternative ribosome rescue aminoacyl-tRNA hydrolase ArfB [Mucilaginibacter sp. L3T2-6]MDV6216950.1 alternative ribosome rescue aminoacyl-tRNA hydrolase ArfB [Mucilaginibacter sp. L3T2-6]
MNVLKKSGFPAISLNLQMNFTRAGLQKEITYKTSRSGGKGGQNVNKVSTKVELLFSVENSALFTEEEKSLISSKLQSRLNKDGLVQIICDEERSQYLNKEKAVEKLVALLTRSLQKPKIRKPAKVSKAAKAARLDSKKINSAKKEGRRGNWGDSD